MACLAGVFLLALVASLWINAHALDIGAWAFDRYGPLAGRPALDPAGLGWQDSFQRWLVYFSPYSQIGNFVAGCLAARLYEVLGRSRPSAAEARAGSIATYAGLAAMALAYVTSLTNLLGRQPDAYTALHMNCLFMLPAAVLIFCCARYATRVSGLLSWRPLVLAGEASYSIYLLHMAILHSAPWGPLPASANALGWSLLRLVVAIVVIVLVARGLYLAFERPAQRATRRALLGLVDRIEQRAAGALRSAARPYRAVAVVGLVAAAATLAVRIHAHSPAPGIGVLEATYGANCGGLKGNVSQAVWRECRGRGECAYAVRVERLGDPAPGCVKTFEAVYACSGDAARHRREISSPNGVGFGETAALACASAAR
jgi:hypothetical protein